MRLLPSLVLGLIAFALNAQGQSCPGDAVASVSLSQTTLTQPQTLTFSLSPELELALCEELPDDLALTGFVGATAHVDLELSADVASGMLLSTRSSCDTLLLVQDPEGMFHFNDDGGSVQQALLMLPGAAGSYRIWVGQFDEAAECSSALILSPADQGCFDTTATAGQEMTIAVEEPDDPQVIGLIAGGSQDLATCGPETAEGLSGFVSRIPQVALSLQIPATIDVDLAQPMRLSVPQLCDTLLIALDSEGTLHVNDDFEEDSFSPGLEFTLGQLDGLRLWVGTYEVAACDIELVVEPAPMEETPQTVEVGALGCPARDNAALEEAPLAEVFDRPLTVPMGGPQNLELCGGPIADIAGFGFTQGAATLDLVVEDAIDGRLTVDLTSGCDGTLLALDPSGAWHFNDDTDGINPSLSFSRTLEGIYRLWTGTYDQEISNCTGRLTITSTTVACPNPELSSKETIDLDLESVGGESTHRLVAGGETALSDCEVELGLLATGYMIDRPDLAFNLDLTEDAQVRFESAGQCDTVLLVQDPQGQWHFSDDGVLEGTGGLITVDGAGAGAYKVWLGTFEAELCEGSVTVKRGLSKN